MLHQTTSEALLVETTAVPPTAPARVRHQADPLHDYRNEHLELQEELAEMWGPEEPYTPVAEETGSFFQRYYYGWIYETVLLASKEKLTKRFLPLPTRDCRAHECGLKVSRSIQKAMYERNAWSCMVGTAVVSTLDPASRGVLRWVGVPQQGGYTRMMAGVEWSVPPAVRTAARSDDSAASPFFDGVVHGEHLFTPEHSDMSTLEEVTQVNLDLSSRGGVVAIPTPKRLSLFRLLVTTLPYYFVVQVPFLFVSNICTILLPMLLQAFVDYISSPDPTWPHGLAIVGGVFFIQVTASFCMQRYNYLSFHCGLQYRSALNAVIFEKCMIISNKALAQPEMNAGRIINMVGTDVERAYFFMLFGMLIWSSPLLLLLAILQLARVVGWCSILAFLCFIAPTPLTAYFRGIQRAARHNIMKATDARVKATNEFFSGIRVAKFMTWEPRFIANIEAKRAVELFFLKKIQTSRIMMAFVNNAMPIFMIAIVLTLYYYIERNLSLTVVFPTIALLGVMRQPFQQIPWVFTMFIQFMISIGRINRFLECDNAACSSVQDIEDYFTEQHAHSTACQLAAVLENVDVTAYVPVKLPFAPKIKASLISRVLRMMCCEQCKPTKRRPAPTAVAEELIYASPTSVARRVIEGGRSPASKTSPTAGRGGAKPPEVKKEEFFELEPTGAEGAAAPRLCGGAEGEADAGAGCDGQREVDAAAVAAVAVRDHAWADLGCEEHRVRAAAAVDHERDGAGQHPLLRRGGDGPAERGDPREPAAGGPGTVWRRAGDGDRREGHQPERRAEGAREPGACGVREPRGVPAGRPAVCAGRARWRARAGRLLPRRACREDACAGDAPAARCAESGLHHCAGRWQRGVLREQRGLHA
ncbi:ATP-binding cassette protein subfamily C member 1, partial [Lotmaria passim]